MKKQIILLAAAWGWQSAMADVHFDGLYHNNINLDPETEAVPNHPTNAFRELQYDANRVVFHFLTESPAGNLGESVETSVRIYSSFEQNPAAFWVANILLEPTNQFHGAVTSGSFPLDLWRAEWQVPHGFTGTVYYAPRIVTKNGGVQTDQQYLLTSIGANVGPQWGSNDLFYTTDAQAIGDDPFGLDYSFVWTNYVPFNFDYFYFNHTNAGLPQNEEVPGLGGVKFFDYHYEPTEPSYVYLVAPPGGLLSMQTRFFFVNGGGEVYRPGAWYTNVVVSDSSPFHGLPASGSITLEVWRTAFFPPANWADSVYYAHEITTPLDGTTWLVTDPHGTNGVNVTNSFDPPQYFYTGGPFFRDWGFTPTGAIARQSVKRDYFYHNNTAQNPQTEAVPGVTGKVFLRPNYATTTTTFYVITDHPGNAVPGENLYVQMRIDYDHPETGYSGGEWHNLAFEQNLVITSTPGFHGLPLSGTHTVDLWRLDWPQPRSTNPPFAAFTNAITIYYAPFIKTTFGQFEYETDFAFLTASGTANNYPIQPQHYAASPFGVDYSYVNQFEAFDADGDGLPDAWEVQHFGTLTNLPTSDNDDDGLNNWEEYIADTQPTNAASFFGVITNLVRAANEISLFVNPSSTARVYDAYTKTNLMTGTGWMPYGLNVTGNGGVLQLTVTNNLDSSNFRTGVRLP